jgi:hypothetical protein
MKIEFYLFNDKFQVAVNHQVACEGNTLSEVIEKFDKIHSNSSSDNEE